MADISLFQAPNGDEFNIKDTTARTAAQQAQSTADSKISSSLKGAANGVAELDASGKVPALQLPSYVDDVLEYASKSAFPSTGETGKIYVDLATNLTYRWSGSAYVEISPSLALGETSSTAYRGDRGKTAYDHATESGKVSSATAVGLYKVGSTAQGHISGLTAVTKADITALGIPAQLYGECTTDANVVAKTVTVSDFVSLQTGMTIYVKFRYYNSASNPTLNVNSSGAKAIRCRYSQENTVEWFGGQIVSFTYDGTIWIMNDVGIKFPEVSCLDNSITVLTSRYTETDPTLGTLNDFPQGYGIKINSVDWSKLTNVPNYRLKTDNDFDTISVTDLTAGDVVVTGVGRFTNGLYGNLTGNADTATKATQDESGNNIKATYASSFSISDHTITLKNKNGASLGTVTVPDNNTTYSLSASGESVVLTGSNSSTSSTTLSTLINGLSTGSSTPVDTDYYVSQYANGGSTTTSYHRRPMAALWNYIKGKADSTYLGINANAVSATKATQDGSGNVITSSYTPYKGNLNGTIGSASPASAMKTYWDNNDNIKTNSVNTAYNTSGQEYAFLLSKGGSNQYGAVIRWGYGTKYFEILRKYGSTWKDDDWVKMDAGYADTAGSATTATTATKATQDSDGNAINTTYFKLSGGTITGVPKFGSGSISAFSGNIPYILGIESFADGGAVKWKASSDVSVGSATTASKLGSSNVGSATQPIYLSAGTATACTYTLGKSVPSDAVFTDHYAWTDITGKPSTFTPSSHTHPVSDLTWGGGVNLVPTATENGQEWSIDLTPGSYIGTYWQIWSVKNSKTIFACYPDDNSVTVPNGKLRLGKQLTVGGTIAVSSANYGNWNEGIRINKCSNNIAALVLGGDANSESGTADNVYFIGTYDNRKLYISHNGAQDGTTYFYADSSTQKSPSLQIGSDLRVNGISYLGAGNNGTKGGISLYDGTAPTTYGIAMRTTTNSGKHGAVQGDWAIYSYMNDQDNRGWILKRDGVGGVASVDTSGNAVFNGYVGIGGNTTNTSGVRAQYNSTTKSLDFVFVA